MKSPILMDMANIHNFSFSKLSTYHTCPYQYYRNYIKRQHGENNGFSEYGSVVHEILENYFRGNLEVFELEQKYEEAIADVEVSMLLPSKNGHIRKDITNSYYRGGLEYFQNFEDFPGMTVIGVEERFNVLMEHKGKKFMLNGFIDLVCEKDGELYVIDHKSKAKFKNSDEKKKYFRQLALYSIYISKKYGKPVKELWFNQFRIHVLEKCVLTDEILTEALDWAVDTIEQIDSETMWLPKIDNFYCLNLCNYRYTCHYSELYDESENIA